MFTKIERLISYRNLKPKKKEGFLKTISIFSFFGIMLGVAILIIVMSIMNGFRTDLTKKILGLNPHIIIQPNSFEIDDSYISKLKTDFQDISLSRSFSGEGIVISNNNAKGVILKGINKDEQKTIEFFKNFIASGDFKNFSSNNVLIGSNATILPVNICKGAVIGAGSVVTKDIKIKGIYAGNPAKLIRKL